MSNIKNPDTCTYKTLFEQQQVDQYNIDFLNLYQKVRKELLKLSTSKCRPKIIKNQIHTYQHYSINILGQLQLNAHQCGYKKHCLKHIIIPKINFHIEFLKFLKEQFPKHFDNNAPIPISLFKRYREECIRLLEKAINQINCTPSKKNLQIIIDELDIKKYTFQEYDILRNTVNAIHTQANILNQEENSFLQIVKIFIEENYNPNSICKFIIGEFTNSIKESVGKFEMINHLKYLDKEISQAKEKKVLQNSLKSSLKNWIKQELNYYKYSFHVADSAKIPERSVQSPPETIKVKTNISVGQMACILRQMIETKVIETDNKKETIKMFSEVFTSKNSDSISEKSLTNKFFNIDDKSAEATKQLFLDLFKSIRN
ncbi:hypothetical protein [Labilibacter marinus]|uniref:hypothetical protein n=1 Tax=Labilibacter marinus TaxID=1477105 RepID=UPI00117BABDC|nr:hypothetical protein [Labilibacter marinus]